MEEQNHCKMKRQRTATTESAASSVAAAASAAVARALGGDGGRGGDASRTVVRSPAVVIPLITLEKSKLKVRKVQYIYIYVITHCEHRPIYVRQTPSPMYQVGMYLTLRRTGVCRAVDLSTKCCLRENTFLLFTFYLILVNEPGG